MTTSFAITLVVTNPAFAAAYGARFRHLPRASVVESRWETLPPHDCFVTAGNSYGLMSAGIDAVVVREFGPSIEQAVQLHILNTYLGEQPVGTAFLLPTGNARVPMLCHAPTMRVPRDISGTDNVYRATLAALLCVYHHNRTAPRRIATVVFPSFGTGFGGVPPNEAARQMAVAWELFLQVPYPPNWERVVRREQLISGTGTPDRRDS